MGVKKDIYYFLKILRAEIVGRLCVYIYIAICLLNLLVNNNCWPLSLSARRRREYKTTRRAHTYTPRRGSFNLFSKHTREVPRSSLPRPESSPSLHRPLNNVASANDRVINTLFLFFFTSSPVFFLIYEYFFTFFF